MQTERGRAWRIAVVAGKGGVGKTTTTINLAASLADAGRRCLVVDCDPQSNLTSGLGINPYEPRPTVADVIAGRCTASQAIVPTVCEGLHLLPASPDLSAVEADLPSQLNRELRLRDALLREGVDDDYAVVLFDTPPSFGFHTVSALVAAQRILIPLQMSGFALRGLREVLRTVSVARRQLNRDLEVLGAVSTFVARTRFARDILETLEDAAPVPVFRTRISHGVRLQETSLACVPVMLHAPGSRADEEYRALAAEVADALGLQPAAVPADPSSADAEPVGWTQAWPGAASRPARGAAPAGEAVDPAPEVVVTGVHLPAVAVAHAAAVAASAAASATGVVASREADPRPAGVHDALPQHGGHRERRGRIGRWFRRG